MGTILAAALVSKVTIKLISLCDLEKVQVPMLDRWRSLQVRGRDGDVNTNAIPHNRQLRASVSIAGNEVGY